MDRYAHLLIVTVTKVESLAVMQVFREVTDKAPTPVSTGERIYHDLGEVNGARVFMALSEMGSGGLGASHQAVQKGIEALSPEAVIMVGIAFGVSEGNQSLGDVLVSRQLLLYDPQRLGAGEIILRGDKPHASPWLIDYLKSADLYVSNYTVRFGLLLSGEKLVDNVDYRDQLKRLEPEAIGGEMEGAGLYVACQDKKVDWVLVKAICDWADGKKAEDKDERQKKAARNAARFVVHALQHAPLKGRIGLNPGETRAGQSPPEKLAWIRQRDDGGFDVSDGQREQTLPKRLPDPHVSSGQLTGQYVRHWKRLHTLTEVLYKQHYATFRLCVASLQAVAKLEVLSELQKRAAAAQGQVDQLKPAIEEFEGALKRLPVGRTRLGVHLRQISFCMPAIKRHLAADVGTDELEAGLLLAEQIAQWLLEALHHADLMLEKYFAAVGQDGPT